MSDNSTINFYNNESKQYSKKRYSINIETYVQFFFNARREIVFRMVSSLIKDRKDLTLLDIACADGVLTRGIDQKFPGIFSKLIGTDISLNMILVAKDHVGNDHKFSFYVKDECPKDKSDIALGLGYMTADIFEDEMNFLFDRLPPGGYYLCSFAGRYTPYSLIKLRNVDYVKSYRTYSQYKKMLKKYFEVVDEVPYGFFIPKLWSFPAVGRVLQPIFDALFRYIAPNMFHEKVYLLRRKV